MNKQIIKTLKELDKYYSLEYLIDLTTDVSKIFSSCDIVNYLKDQIKPLTRKRGTDIFKEMPTGEQFKLTVVSDNSDEFERYVRQVEEGLVDDLAEVYSELFDKIMNNRGTVRDCIDDFDKSKLCEFESIAEWLITIYSNNTIYASFRRTMSSSSIKKFFELKHYFIKGYSYECWLAYEVICLYSYFNSYKNCCESNKKRFGILGKIGKVVKPRNFNKAFYTKTY